MAIKVKPLVEFSFTMLSDWMILNFDSMFVYWLYIVYTEIASNIVNDGWYGSMLKLGCVSFHYVAQISSMLSQKFFFFFAFNSKMVWNALLANEFSCFLLVIATLYTIGSSVSVSGWLDTLQELFLQWDDFVILFKKKLFFFFIR